MYALHHLPPMIGEPKLLSPLIDILHVDQLAAGLQHASDIAKMLIGTAFMEVPELCNNHIFRGRNEAILIGQDRPADSTSQLHSSPGIVPCNHEIDLVSRGRVNHVELPSRQNGLASSTLAHIKIGDVPCIVKTDSGLLMV